MSVEHQKIRWGLKNHKKGKGMQEMNIFADKNRGENRKTKRKAAAGLAVLVGVMTILPGCSMFGTNAVSLTKTAMDKVQKAESAHVRTLVDLDVAVEYEALNFNMDMGMNFDVDTEATMDPKRSKSVVATEVELFGQKETVNTTTYTEEPGDGTSVNYTEIDGKWTKTTTELPEDDGEEKKEVNPLVLGLGLSKAMSDKTLTAELEEETTEVNGQEAYKINCEITGEPLKTLLEMNSGTTEKLDFDLEKVDWSTVNVPAELYIYKESKYPARIVMDLDTLADQVLAQKLDDFVADVLDGVPVDGLKLTITGCKVDMTFDRYNEIDEIVIPEEAKNAEEAADVLDDITSLFE